MTPDDLADHLAAHFRALPGKPIAVEVIVPETVAEVYAENQTTWKVYVWPQSEDEEPVTEDTCRVDMVCNVVINGPVKPPLTRRKGAELLRFIRRSLRETEFEGYAWNGNTTEVYFDYEALLARNQYISLFRPTYLSFE